MILPVSSSSNCQVLKGLMLHPLDCHFRLVLSEFEFHPMTHTNKNVDECKGFPRSRWAVSCDPMSRSPTTCITALRNAIVAMSVSRSLFTQTLSISFPDWDLGSPLVAYFAT